MRPIRRYPRARDMTRAGQTHVEADVESWTAARSAGRPVPIRGSPARARLVRLREWDKDSVRARGCSRAVEHVNKKRARRFGPGPTRTRADDRRMIGSTAWRTRAGRSQRHTRRSLAHRHAAANDARAPL